MVTSNTVWIGTSCARIEAQRRRIICRMKKTLFAAVWLRPFPAFLAMAADDVAGSPKIGVALYQAATDESPF
jgi:hypothetical protein